jgi:hypothetical protein
MCVFVLFSCGQTDVNVITNEKFLLSPIKAAEFFSFFSKENLNVSTDVVSSSQELIKFLNFSTYNVVLTDKKTADFITSKLSDWVKLCKIAEWRGDFYYLLVKNSFLKKQKKVIAFLKGWGSGIDYLKDPAVKKVLEREERIYIPKGIKFFSCEGW